MPTDIFEEAFGSASPSGQPGCRAKLFNCGCIVALVAVVLAVAAAVPWYGAYARIRQAVNVGTVTQPVPRDRLPRPEDIGPCREPRYLLWTSASAVAGSDMPHWLFAVDNVRGDLWQVAGGPTGYLWDRVETGTDTSQGVLRTVGYALPTEWFAVLVPEPSATLNVFAASPLFRECEPTILVDMTSHGSLAAVPVAEAPAVPDTVRRPWIRRRPARQRPPLRLNQRPRWRSRSLRRPHRQPTPRFFQPLPPCRPRRHRKAPRGALQWS